MKKSLSILLALLMILSSLPVMAFTASAEQADPNVMADYTYEDWYTRSWGSATAGDESCKGGNSVKFNSVNYHYAFTFVNLETNTNYLLDFDWKSVVDDALGGIVPSGIYVYPESVYGSKEDLTSAGRGTNDANAVAGSGLWNSNAGFYPKGYTTVLSSVQGVDLETKTDDSNPRKNATGGTWQHVSTSFKTNATDTEYAIMFRFDSNSVGAGQNAINTSDYRLIKATDSESIAIEDKIAGDWYCFQHSAIYDDNSFTSGDITSDFRVEKPVYQKISTVVELQPNTIYSFSFDYFAETHSKGNPYVNSVRIFDYASGSVLEADNWTKEADYNKTYTDLESGGSYGSASGAGSWQKVSTKFTTTEATKYNIIINFNASGFDNAQKVYLANFKLLAPAAKPGNILNNATYANGDVSWTVDGGNTSWLDPRMNYASGLDNFEMSAYGGYTWGFGYAGGSLAGDVYAHINIKAKGLKAGATYDFSYVYADGFRFLIEAIKSGDNAATYVAEPSYVDLGNPNGKFVKGAEKMSAMFTVPADGDYVITLKTNRDMATPYNCWKTTYLCDLELYERGTMYNVSVSKEGNGAASASATGLVEEGTAVTFTATAEKYENFLGWYVNGALVSEEVTYVATVAGDLAPVAKFTANSENLMADYSVANGNFASLYYGTVSDNAMSHLGGNSILVYNAPHQNLVTKVTLEAGKKYYFGFDWMAVDNEYNNLYPNAVKVVKVSNDKNILNKSDWVDGTGYTGQMGADIEAGGTYGTQEQANACTWNTLSTTFTPTESGDYGIMVSLTHDKIDGTHYNNSQSMYVSDFVLKEKPEITYTGTKYEWAGVHWSKVSASEDTKDGGYAYNVASAMSQNINTELTLKPGTTYKYSFNWKAVDNAKGLAYVASSSIYSANSGDRSKGNKTNYVWYNEADAAGYTPIYVPNDGYTNLMENVSNPNGTKDAADDVLTAWNTYSANFTTIEDAEYYLFINFGLKGSNGDQAVIISDVVIEEVVEGAAPAGDDMIAHPGVSIRKASESSFGQALRYKFTVDADVIANAQADGYELVEYGTAVAIAEELNGHAADPILDATAYTVKKGVAYDKANGVNVQYDVAENGDVTYTAALYNIPTNKYDAEIAVRPYAIFQNADGDTYVRYGTTRNASVFATVEAILAGSNTSDKDYVNNTLLAGDIMDAYNAWLAK